MEDIPTAQCQPVSKYLSPARTLIVMQSIVWTLLVELGKFLRICVLSSSGRNFLHGSRNCKGDSPYNVVNISSPKIAKCACRLKVSRVFVTIWGRETRHLIVAYTTAATTIWIVSLVGHIISICNCMRIGRYRRSRRRWKVVRMVLFKP